MPFKPGQSGNRAGRPVTSHHAAKIRKLILAAAPDVVLSIVWPGDPIPPDCAEHWALHWPEELQNGDLGASSPLGIPKAT